MRRKEESQVSVTEDLLKFGLELLATPAVGDPFAYVKAECDQGNHGVRILFYAVVSSPDLSPKVLQQICEAHADVMPLPQSIRLIEAIIRDRQAALAIERITDVVLDEKVRPVPRELRLEGATHGKKSGGRQLASPPITLKERFAGLNLKQRLAYGVLCHPGETFSECMDRLYQQSGSEDGMMKLINEALRPHDRKIDVAAVHDWREKAKELQTKGGKKRGKRAAKAASKKTGTKVKSSQREGTEARRAMLAQYLGKDLTAANLEAAIKAAGSAEKLARVIKADKRLSSWGFELKGYHIANILASLRVHVDGRPVREPQAKKAGSRSKQPGGITAREILTKHLEEELTAENLQAAIDEAGSRGKLAKTVNASPQFAGQGINLKPSDVSNILHSLRIKAGGQSRKGVNPGRGKGTDPAEANPGDKSEPLPEIFHPLPSGCISAKVQRSIMQRCRQNGIRFKSMEELLRILIGQYKTVVSVWSYLQTLRTAAEPDIDFEQFKCTCRAILGSDCSL